MKYLVTLGLIPMSLTVFSAEVDYSKCQANFNSPQGYGSSKEGFPFKLESDGKVKVHKDANYVFDQATNTEKITYKYEGLGDGIDSSVVIKRNEKGELSQVIYNNEFKGIKTQTGLGSQFPNAPVPGFMGMGLMGGMGGGMGPSKSSYVTDVKIKSGKCFPYRSVSLIETNGNTHKSFANDVELCRDIKKMLKQEGTEGSEGNKLKACYDQYQEKAQKILAGHKERNDDLYNPKENRLTEGAWGSGGYYGNPVQGSFGNGQGGYGYPGGFAGSIDNIVQNQMFTPAEKLKMLSQYCVYGSPAQEEMINDDSLFVEEPSQNQGGGSSQESSVIEK